MARVYPYRYKGELRAKQDKCRTDMPLDKDGIWLDFNELCAMDQDDESPIYLFSQADIVNDSNGNDVELYDGMEVSIFDEDFDISNMPDALLADGVIIKNFFGQYPRVKWLIRLVKHKMGHKTGKGYVGLSPLVPLLGFHFLFHPYIIIIEHRKALGLLAHKRFSVFCF